MALRLLDGFETAEAALTRNRQEAVRRGVGRRASDGTLYWWPVQKHPDRNEWALVIDGVDNGGLGVQERSRLQNEATARAGGWFPDLGAGIQVQRVAAVPQVKPAAPIQLAQAAWGKIKSWFA